MLFKENTFHPSFSDEAKIFCSNLVVQIMASVKIIGTFFTENPDFSNFWMLAAIHQTNNYILYVQILAHYFASNRLGNFVLYWTTSYCKSCKKIIQSRLCPILAAIMLHQIIYCATF